MDYCEFIDPHLQNAQGQTALHVAASKGDSSAIFKLLEMGADLNLSDQDGNLPMHMVFQYDMPMDNMDQQIDNMMGQVKSMVPGAAKDIVKNTTKEVVNGAGGVTCDQMIYQTFEKFLNSPYCNQLDVNQPNLYGETIFSLAFHHHLPTAMLLIDKFEIGEFVCMDDEETLTERLFKCLMVPAPDNNNPTKQIFSMMGMVQNKTRSLIPTYHNVNSWDEFFQMAREDPDCLTMVSNNGMVDAILNGRLVDRFQLNPHYYLPLGGHLIVAPCHIIPDIKCQNPRQPMYSTTMTVMYQNINNNPTIVAYPVDEPMPMIQLPTANTYPGAGKLVSFLIRRNIPFRWGYNDLYLLDFLPMDAIRTMAHYDVLIPLQTTLPRPVCKYGDIVQVYSKVRMMSVFLEMKWLKDSGRLMEDDTPEFLVIKLNDHLIRQVVECLYGSVSDEFEEPVVRTVQNNEQCCIS